MVLYRWNIVTITCLLFYLFIFADYYNNNIHSSFLYLYNNILILYMSITIKLWRMLLAVDKTISSLPGCLINGIVNRKLECIELESLYSRFIRIRYNNFAVFDRLKGDYNNIHTYILDPESLIRTFPILEWHNKSRSSGTLDKIYESKSSTANEIYY